MSAKKSGQFLGVLTLFALGASTAGASLLEFENLSTYASLYTYGSNMTSACTGSGQAGCVGEGNGFTPDIAVSYATLGYAAEMAQWPTGYGNLPGAAYSLMSGNTPDITLTPQNGATVTLNSFELAGYYETDYSNQPVEVLDADNNILWSYTGNISGSGPSSTQFTVGITSSGPLQIEFGNNWNVGIEDINFDENVSAPEPAAWLLLVSGLGLGVLLKRRALPGV